MLNDSAPNPVPVSPIRVRLKRVGHGETLLVRFLDQKSRGMFTHYQETGSLHCPVEDCPLCKKLQRQTWKGYIPCQVLSPQVRHWLPFVFEVTEGLDQRLRHEDLKGQVWEIHRPAKQGNKPQEVEGKKLYLESLENLPLTFDVRPILTSIYGVRNLRLDVACPVPDRMFIAPEELTPHTAALVDAPLELDGLTVGSPEFRNVVNGLRTNRMRRRDWPQIAAWLDKQSDTNGTGQGGAQ
jgi:hypothetical protein